MCAGATGGFGVGRMCSASLRAATRVPAPCTFSDVFLLAARARKCSHTCNMYTLTESSAYDIDTHTHVA